MSLKIFVVEDDPNYSQVLSFQLKQSGFDNITPLSSGEECLENLNKKPDLVLLDFSLTGINGLDTLLQIREKSPATKVIVLTGIDDKKVKKDCLEAGAFDYLLKKEESFEKILTMAEDILKQKKNRKIKGLILTIIILVLIVISLILKLR